MPFRLRPSYVLAALFCLLMAPVAEALDADTFMLDNGLQVVVIPDHRSPVVTHMVWYKVGSADEEPGKAGVAHFLEHLMFKGTGKFPGKTFSDAVAAVGGQENAFTSSDYTAYFQRVARENLPMVMEMEADRMTNLILTDDIVKTERDVVLEERRSRVDNDPGTRLGEALDSVFHVEHPYGRPIIGWQDEIEALNREDALDVYRRYYTPNNAILVVAGDVEQAEVRKLAEKYYGPIERRADAPPRVRHQDPDLHAARSVSLADPRVEQENLRRVYRVPSYSTAEPGEAEALDILAEVIAGGPTSVLYRKLVVERKIATGAGGYYQGSSLDDTAFNFFVVPAAGVSLEAVEKAFDEELASLVKEGVSSDEIERAKKSVLADAIYAQDSQASLARIFGIALTTGSSVEAVEQWPDRIRKVSPDAVNAALRQYFRIENSATGYLRSAPAETAKEPS
ncbi:MAG: insulinase family protein [Rhodobiaceae bacterium]|nr:insulinase family protein [Rhodobiaceae bacterium]MCC0054876.1 insulinase family protein [Rhodobiaceae bacterium]